MAKKCLVVKQGRKPKFSTRSYHRCQVCGRQRGIYRQFMLCRICFRLMAHKGLIPGVVKASW